MTHLQNEGIQETTSHNTKKKNSYMLGTRDSYIWRVLSKNLEGMLSRLMPPVTMASRDIFGNMAKHLSIIIAGEGTHFMKPYIKNRNVCTIMYV